MLIEIRQRGVLNPFGNVGNTIGLPITPTPTRTPIFVPRTTGGVGLQFSFTFFGSASFAHGLGWLNRPTDWGENTTRNPTK